MRRISTRRSAPEIATNRAPTKPEKTECTIPYVKTPAEIVAVKSATPCAACVPAPERQRSEPHKNRISETSNLVSLDLKDKRT
jgi:hypothetical protein